MFEECGYEIYEGRETIIEFVQTKEQKEAENRRLSVVELTEKIRDKYWNVEEMGNAEKTEAFISMLETSINPIISKFDNQIK
ncbi:hypothetical protein RclHR1_00920002 [Rhizophagus clarus]|nr:hypothetical protein RclHR1_16890001 [Rhizophagus clarus]GBB91674.1 hypothetical protein RclHR1_19020004 [Rhizophagus clarus]GBC09884.1 hypothetical protein RclHR1_00920002 [Rhizophagus clarus]